MLVVTTVDGKEYDIKFTEYYKNAKDLIRLLTNKSVIKVDYVESIHEIYILAKYIVSVRDA
jgi:hypothetical protein